MKKILAFILTAIMLVSVFAVAASAEDTTAIKTAGAAYGTPVIDGTIDAIWSKTTAYAYDTDTKTTDSSSIGQFRVMWDETYIYFLAEIKDTTMMDEATTRADKNWYHRDQVAMAFNIQNDRTATNAAGASTAHFWYAYRPYGVVPNFCNVSPKTFLYEADGALGSDSLDFVKYPMSARMYAYTITADGYVIEAKINLTAKDSTWTNAAGKKIGFETFVYGNDYTAQDTAPAQDHVYPWADRTVTAYKDNSKKGQIELLAKTNPKTGDSLYVVAALAVVAVLGTAVVVKRKFN